MIHTVQDFLELWTAEAGNTSQLFPEIPDELLHKKLIPNEKTVGELVWHLLEVPKALLDQAGLRVEGPSFGSKPPKTMKEVIDEFGKVIQSVLKKVHDNWDDASLDKTEKVFGQTWRRSDILLAILFHLIHFRGELITLLRVGGVKIPSFYQIKG